MPTDTPVYPIARPTAGDADARFSVGLGPRRRRRPAPPRLPTPHHRG